MPLCRPGIRQYVNVWVLVEGNARNDVHREQLELLDLNLDLDLDLDSNLELNASKSFEVPDRSGIPPMQHMKRECATLSPVMNTNKKKPGAMADRHELLAER